MMLSTQLRLAVAGAGFVAFFAVAGAGLQTALAQAPQVPAQDPTPVPVWGKVKADNACFVRLPDLPGKRYGGFGGVNPNTGVLAFVGGAEKRTEENTIAFHDLFVMDLKRPDADWVDVPYNANTGYTRFTDKGCREMGGVMLPPSGASSRWLSVFGKDGCDNGAFDTSGKKGGDIQQLSIGSTGNSAGVSWVPNSGAQTLPDELAENKGRLVRLFSAYDTERGRVVFGQGTYNEERAELTNDEIYTAKPTGNKWQVSALRTDGPLPSARYGSCAAYVYDQDTGVDGVLVLGGQQGGTVDTASYKEVWWLDFASREAGTWRNITGLFDNMDAFGYRREGACAYNPGTKQFYSWMGRANASIPDGASHSSGVWRTNLSSLGEALQGNATLNWERLAKDKLPGVDGRRLIPSVYDWANNRLFALGGRNGLSEFADSWVIYPDVTGAACDDLQVVVDVPTPGPTSPPPPTRTPDPGGSATAVPPPPLDPGAGLAACAYLLGRVPNAAVNEAVANPDRVYGYNVQCFPNRPASPFNRLRNKLSLRNPSVDYHAVFNGLVWKCGCP